MFQKKNGFESICRQNRFFDLTKKSIFFIGIGFLNRSIVSAAFCLIYTRQADAAYVIMDLIIIIYIQLTIG